MKLRTFRKGGIHVPENKLAPAEIHRVQLPRTVVIPLKQHIGMAAEPIVCKGDHVTRGQKIAEARGRVCAPVHASISGKVVSIDKVRLLTGMYDEAITITADAADHEADTAALTHETCCDYSHITPSEIVATVADAGVVGLGGATFPTAVKLSPPPGTKATILIINAVECEPYLTCDNALMLAHPEDIVEGIELMLKASGCTHAVIGIEDNKSQAAAALQRAIGKRREIRVQMLHTKYPQGSEKQLIYAITGLEVKSGELPISVGAIVQNVGTAYAVYCAVALRRPLIERIVTVDRIGNFLVPVGMCVGEIINGAAAAVAAAEGIAMPAPDATLDVVIGGPMMGRSAATLDAPVTKGTSGVVFLSPMAYNPDPCIRCGACVDGCPMGLEPYLISAYGRLGNIDSAAASGAMDCIECGSCSYSCPSARPILDYIRKAKAGIRERKK